MSYYKLHVQRVTCRCGASHTESSLYLFKPGGANPLVRGMQPAAFVEPGIEIRKIGLAPRTIPVCHSCVSNATVPDFVEAAEWTDTLRKKREEESRAKIGEAAEGRSAAPRLVTADELA